MPSFRQSANTIVFCTLKKIFAFLSVGGPRLLELFAVKVQIFSHFSIALVTLPETSRFF